VASPASHRGRFTGAAGKIFLGNHSHRSPLIDMGNSFPTLKETLKDFVVAKDLHLPGVQVMDDNIDCFVIVFYLLEASTAPRNILNRFSRFN
jgi:hypothetical protein